MTASIVIVGCGNMGRALVDGWIAHGQDPASIVAVEPDASRQQSLAEEHGISVVADPADLKAHPTTLVLAVKPQILADVLPLYHRFTATGALFLSVAAGIRLSALADGLGAEAPLIRAMPNTPSAIGRGMTVLCGNALVGGEQRAMGERLMGAVGAVSWIEDEALMDAVTALSGSGPAYVFHFAECLINAGIAAGLPAHLAERLARQTIAGAAELLQQSDSDPGKLRHQVTSPGGTTAAAMEVLMAEPGLRQLLADAVEAAAARSREMAG